MKMGIPSVFIGLQIIVVYSLASKILVHDDNVHQTIAATNIVDTCFGSSERWSELLIIPDHSSDRLLENIHRKIKTSNSILFPNCEGIDELTSLGEPLSYATAIFEWQETKASGIIITTHNLSHLECVLYSLKNNIQRLWRPRSYFIFILDTGCDVEMFKVIWKYWILNALILCSSDNSANRNNSETELYTYNPYSAVHSPEWEKIVYETVEVSMSTGDFDHSWYIFKKMFTRIGSLKECDDLYFDKTSNLDGYVVPVSVGDPNFFADEIKTTGQKFLMSDKKMLETIASKLQFNVAEVFNSNRDLYGRQLPNGSYFASINDIYEGRSHLAPTRRGMRNYPGIEVMYPHDKLSGCFASRIVGNYPQWTNLAVARQIWIGLGLALLLAAVILYLQNKPQGIVSAVFDALRLLIGSSVIRTSPVGKHRILLGSIFLVFLVLDGAIRGRFISVLTVVRSYPNLDTIEQLDEMDVDMYGYITFREAIKIPWRNARYNESPSFDDCIEGIEREGRQQACFRNCPYLSYQSLNLSIIHRTLKPVWTMAAGCLATMHWPMTDRYSFEVQKLFEAGMYMKWESDLARDSEVKEWKQNRELTPPYVKPTKLNDLLPAFMLLFVGLSLSVIAFTWETKCTK